MELFKIWIITTIAAFIVSTKYDMRFIKDLAKKGYIIDKAEFEYQGYSLSYFANHRYTLVPIINLLQSIFEAYYYKSDFDYNFRLLFENSLLTHMTEDEEKEYNKRKSYNTLLDILGKREKNLKKSEFIILEDDTYVWFEFLNNEIEIINIKGPRNIFQKEEIISEIEKKIGKINRSTTDNTKTDSYHFSGYESHDLNYQTKKKYHVRKQCKKRR